MARPILRRRRKKWYTIAARPVVASVPPPLDAIAPGAVAAYSYRKLRTAYAGVPVNIQRDSDTTNTDVGFAGTDFDAGTYTTFVSGGGGRNRLWYDQSGNTNVENGVAGTSGLPVTFSHVPSDNGRYGAFATSGDNVYMTASTNASITNIWATGGFVAIVLRVEGIPNSTSAAMIAKGTTAGWGIFVFNNNGPYVLVPYWKGTSDGFVQVANANAIPALTLHVVTVAWSAATPAVAPVVTLDGVTCGLGAWTAPTGTFANDVGQAMILLNDNMLDALNKAFGGGLFEVMLWNSVPSAAAQTALIANMKTYYGIP